MKAKEQTKPNIFRNFGLFLDFGFTETELENEYSVSGCKKGIFRFQISVSVPVSHNPDSLAL